MVLVYKCRKHHVGNCASWRDEELAAKIVTPHQPHLWISVDKFQCIPDGLGGKPTDVFNLAAGIRLEIHYR